MEYYNQLYFLEKRFFPIDRKIPIMFHWYVIYVVTVMQSFETRYEVAVFLPLFHVRELLHFQRIAWYWFGCAGNEFCKPTSLYN